MDFGEKIRQLRNNKDLTQPEAAEAMGIEQSYLSKLENDKSLPSNDVLNRILDVFGLEIGDLVSDLSQGAKNQLRQSTHAARPFWNAATAFAAHYLLTGLTRLRADLVSLERSLFRSGPARAGLAATGALLVGIPVRW